MPLARIDGTHRRRASVHLPRGHAPAAHASVCLSHGHASTACGERTSIPRARVAGVRRAVHLSRGHASPARREPPRIPEETVPETRQQRYGADAPQRRTQQDDTDDPERETRSVVGVEAFRFARRLAGHQCTPKSVLTDRTRVAPVEVRLAIVGHAAVVGVLQARISDVDALAVHINVAAT